MKNVMTNSLAFITGVGLGTAVSWKLLKNKYKEIAQEEIDSVKEVYSRKTKATASPKPIEEKKTDSISEKPDLMEYAAKLKEEGYVDYSTGDTEEHEKAPYIITPEHFDEFEDYETQSLTLYNDGYLVDDDDNEIIDIAGVVGEDFRDHIGDFEDDAIHIRNDRLRTDFEILAVERNFKDEAPDDGEE